MKVRIRKSDSAESWLDRVMTQENQPKKDSEKSLAPGRDFSQNFCTRDLYFCCIESVKHVSTDREDFYWDSLSYLWLQVLTTEPVKYILAWINLMRKIASLTWWSKSMEEIDLIYTINMGRISVKYYKYFVNICKIFKNSYL